MAIMYIDESYDKKDKYVVISGLIVPINSWKFFDKAIINIKKSYFRNENFNLKGVRRNKYDKEGIWRKLSLDKQEEFNDVFFNLLNKSDITIITTLLEKEILGGMEKKRLLFYLGYGFLIQRFQYFLNENNIHGIVIMDKSKNKEISDLFHSHRDFLERGVPVDKWIDEVKTGEGIIRTKRYRRHSLDNIIENLIFLDDDYSNCLQVVDMISAAVSGKFNRNLDFYYNRIEPKIRRNDEGKIDGYGLKIFPKHL